MFTALDHHFVEENGLYKKIFQLSPAAIVVIDKDGHIIDMNDRMTEWLGYPKNEIIHKHLIQLPFLNLKNKELLVKNYLQRIWGKEPVVYQAEFLTQTGQKKIGRIDGTLIKNDDGKIIADLAMITEVTQEIKEHVAIKKKEEILEAVNYSARSFLISQATEKDYQELLKSIGIAASVSRVVLVINNLLGQSYEWDAPGMSSVTKDAQYPNLFSGQKDLEMFSNQLQQDKVVCGKKSDFDGAFHQKLEQFGVKSVVILPIFVHNKWWSYLCIQDCTEERTWLDEEVDALTVASKIVGAVMEKNLIELQLQETVEYWKLEKNRVSQEIANTQKFQLAVENATDGVMIMTIDREIVYVNPALERIIGQQFSELDGRKFDSLNTSKTSPQILTKLWDTIQKGEAFSSDDVVLVNKNDDEVPVRLSMFSINDNGKQQFLVGLFEDITRRREVDRVKTEFISIASHQLNTPLSAMKWFLELLQSGKAGVLTDKQQEFVQNLVDSNLRMIALVRSLLNISRIESGRIIIDPHLTDIRVMIDDVVKEVLPFTEKRKQKITVSIDEQITKVFLDPRLIRNVYLNLLTNASKYSPESTEILIEVKKENDRLVSHVIDHGLGIPQNDQDKIFSKFFRASNVVRLKVDGSGLGMYLVKIVVESSGGNLGLESQENKGTDVWFSLPLVGIPPKAGDVSLDQNAYS